MTGRPDLLEVRDLHVTFPSGEGPVRAVRGVSFGIGPGERIGIVGESGSGKSVTALAIMRLLASPPAQVSGGVHLRGTDLLELGDEEMVKVRGGEIAMVFQNPLNSLNPTMTIGDQIGEAIRAHRPVSKREAVERSIDLLARVGIPDPARSAREYPHRFSGGMKQRVMIAMALSCEPSLLIADEPTTALDVTIQAQIIELLASVCEDSGTAVMLVTHDLGVLAGFAERLIVVYAGSVIESGPVDAIYDRALHPYTWGLMSSLTRLDEAHRERLTPIPGAPPSPTRVPDGCAFHPRCPYAETVCTGQVPSLMAQDTMEHLCACHFAGRLDPPYGAREAHG